MTQAHVIFDDFLNTSGATIEATDVDSSGRLRVKLVIHASQQSINAIHDAEEKNHFDMEFESLKGDLLHSWDIEDEDDFYVIITFAVDDCLYSDIAHFRRKLLSTGSWPSSFFLCDLKVLVGENFSQQDLLDTKVRFDFSHSVFDSLRKTSQYLSESKAAIFVDANDTSNASVAIATRFQEVFAHHEEAFNQLPLEQDNFIAVIAEDKGANHLKGVAVFRSSLLEFFKHFSDSKDPIKCAEYLLLNFKKLQDIFLQNYQSFVSQFSLEKIRTELLTEQSKFTDQAAKIIQEITTKLLALPGMAVLSRLLATPDGGAFLLSAKVVIGAVCIILGIYLSIQIHQIFSISEAYKIVYEDFSSKLKKMERGYHFEKLEHTLEKVEKNFCIAICLAFAYLLFVVIAFIAAIVTLP